MAGYRRRFDALFAAYFDGLRESLDAPGLSRFTPRCLDLLRDHSLRGGKRLRVAFLHEAARLVTDDDVPGLDAAALSVELLHTHGLVHDDLIDDSPVRRGGPSAYYAYREEFPGHPGTALGLTVLAGDLAAFLSLRVLLDAELPSTLRQAMLDVQVRAASDAVLGQIVDLERDFPPLPGEDFLHTVSEYKSARYSILAPLRMGLIAAGANPARHDARLRRYAVLVGIAEQMRDDYLDLFGDEETTGKPVGTDLRDGRHTYTVRALLDGTTGAEHSAVTSALGDPHCPAETVERLRDLARARGIDAALRSRTREYARAASAEAASWRPYWREDAVAFFETLPLWGAERTR
ncbi:polyprenyl synthetase family protein [Streptomyces sp. NPDC001985]|uniref:polyprenyl synthetase family protein n=1 Tax=Streptomyces sp. NPDC001985 TaxID=3154406 RepID=UPI003328B743